LLVLPVRKQHCLDIIAADEACIADVEAFKSDFELLIAAHVLHVGCSDQEL